MAVTLTVDVARWRARIDRLAEEATAGKISLLPVIKGNGYGFGRARLAGEAERLGATTIAVGSAYELDTLASPDAAATARALVLTPVASAADAALIVNAGVECAVPTVGSRAHVATLRDAGWRGPVVVKLLSSMRRYGVGAQDLDSLVDAVVDAGMGVEAYGLHLPLGNSDAGAAQANAAEARQWLEHLPAGINVHVSHLDLDALASLANERKDIAVHWRVGTALWLGAGAGAGAGAGKQELHLSTDVIDVRECRANEAAGYRRTPTPCDGHLVMLGAGTAHGIRALDDGRSPFHFARRRLDLLEPPHMHTSMVVVPDGQPCPKVGDIVDVQRPLTQTLVDRVVER